MVNQIRYSWYVYRVNSCQVPLSYEAIERVYFYQYKTNLRTQDQPEKVSEVPYSQGKCGKFWKVILILGFSGNTQGNLLLSAGSSISVQMVCLFHSNMLDLKFLIPGTLHSLILRSYNKNIEYPANTFLLQTTTKIQIPSMLLKDILDMYLNIMKVFCLILVFY